MLFMESASLARDTSTIIMRSAVGAVGTELVEAQRHRPHSMRWTAALSVTPVEYFTEWQQA